jgi:hypothetical protein
MPKRARLGSVGASPGSTDHMVSDDLEACLQAYQFAELLLGGPDEKEGKERREALDAAQRLRDEVEPRYEAVTRDERRSARDLTTLRAARARIDEKLLNCSRTLLGASP